MADSTDRIVQLRARLEALIRRHGEIAVEMYQIKDELAELTSGDEVPTAAPLAPEEKPVAQPPAPVATARTQAQTPLESYSAEPQKSSQIRIPENFERWIGENLISKIGIAITILGVAIGAKYAIDKGWITPVMRIVFGYAVGIGLLFFALRLREKYERFSAVLLSGAMAIFYFISYAAYDYYALIPQAFAFGLMSGITAFTVLAALRYDRVVIGHIALVGAYAVPFLLSDGSGRYAILFSYVIFVNVGILAVSVARYWRSLFYPSFVITWAIFGVWYADRFDYSSDLALGLGFASVFFAIFYASFITYKLLEGLQFAAENILLILANAFVFYGFVYGMASGSETLEQYLGPITIANAAVHLAVAAAIYRFASADRTVVSLLAALVIAFVTISIPVQLDGNWVTLVWITEAAVLFVIARSRSIPLFEWFSYPLVLLAFISLINDWSGAGSTEAVAPLVNPGFLTSALFALSLGVMVRADAIFVNRSGLPEQLLIIARWFVAGLLIFVAYNTLRIEISNYWHQQIFTFETSGSDLSGTGDPYLTLMNFIWQLNYTLAFTFVVWLLNGRYLKKAALAAASSMFGVLWLLVFLTGGLQALAELRVEYLSVSEGVPSHGAGGILVRYAVYAFASTVVFLLYRSSRDPSLLDAGRRRIVGVAFDVFFHFLIFCVLSAELFTWMEIYRIADSGKLALSILWGLYAVALLLIGISRSKKHLRISAIVLFAFTLLKVFFYDLSDLGTISRTVVFVSLGILLLVASFLYSKYREAIFGTDED